MSPVQLFTKGIAKLEASGKIAEDFYASVNENYGRDESDAPVPLQDDDIVVNPLERTTEDVLDIDPL
jgi:hypothetical protein